MHKDNMLLQFFKRSLQNDGKERVVLLTGYEKQIKKETIILISAYQELQPS